MTRLLRPLPVLSIAVGIAVATLGSSRSRAGERLTPELAVQLAVQHHPAARGALQDVKAAEADEGAARTGNFPRVELSEDWYRSTNPVTVFASKLGQESFESSDFALDALNRPGAFTNAVTRLAVRQNVWDAGKTNLGREAASLGVVAAKSSESQTRETVALGALRSFWDAVLADRMVAVARSAEEAAEANRRLSEDQLEAGLAVPSDRMAAEVRLAEVKAMRVRAETGRTVARAALRQALGLSEEREFDLDPPAIEPEDPPASAEEEVKEALRERLDLRSLRTRVEQAAIGERIARSRRLPEIGVGGQYEWNGSFPFDADGDNWTIGASVRWTVFDGNETRHRLARAEADRERVAAGAEGLEDGIRLEVQVAWAQWKAAAERLRLARSATGLAEETLRVVRERYQEGLAVMVELLGAEAARTAAEAAGVEAERDLALAKSSLDFATGRGLVVDRTPENGS